MVKKRKVVFTFLVITSFILQIIAISRIIPLTSSHDLEFTYTYDWDLSGKSGDYYDYDEKMDVKGYYVVDYEGNIGNVEAEVRWSWKATYQGSTYDYDEGNTIYHFQYSLEDGKYIGNDTDQDEFIPNMGVWFYIPEISTKNTHKLLNITYEKTTQSSPSTIWIQSLCPQKGIQFSQSGTFHRSDVYGEMGVEYSSDYFFTDDGYLLGEIYSETDKGYSGGYYSEFEIDSKLFVISSNYHRSLDWINYLLVYWLPILIAYVYFIAWKNYTAFRPKIIVDRRRTYVLQRDVDPELTNLNFASLYLELIPAFLWRTYAQNGEVFSITEDDKVAGLALIDSSDKIATLFGKKQNILGNHGDIKYFFSESSKISHFVNIETYDILKIQNLQERTFEYDAFLVKPLSDFFLPAVVDLIANEDYGKAKANMLNWVHYAMRNEIAYVAVGKMSELWVKDVLTAVEEKNFPPPEAVGEDVVMGVGFAVLCQKVGWLYGLYVHPAFRNMGIGKVLALARISALKELGASEIITEIAEWNGPAKKIYDKFDAQAVGKIYLYGKKKPTVRIRRH